MENGPYIVNFFELLAALMATIHFRKYRSSSEKYFFHFLWFTIGVEVIGAIWGYMFESSNYWVYNVYMLVSFLFYLGWYYSILEQKIPKKMVSIFIVLFIGVSLWNFTSQSWDGYHKYTFVIGAFFTMICTFFHFRQLLYGNEVLILKHKLSFWFSTGLLLFNMGMIPMMLLSDYLEIATSVAYGVMIVGLNAILYCCYVIGFQWAKSKYSRF